VSRPAEEATGRSATVKARCVALGESPSRLESESPLVKLIPPLFDGGGENPAFGVNYFSANIRALCQFVLAQDDVPGQLLFQPSYTPVIDGARLR
jgi:hypothetical protein